MSTAEQTRPTKETNPRQPALARVIESARQMVDELTTEVRARIIDWAMRNGNDAAYSNLDVYAGLDELSLSKLLEESAASLEEQKLKVRGKPEKTGEKARLQKKIEKRRTEAAHWRKLSGTVRQKADRVLARVDELQRL